MLFNSTGTLGVVITYLTNNVTGSLYLTFLSVIVFLIALAVLLRIPTELTIIVVLPLTLVFMAYSSSFLALGGLFLMYLGVVFAKRFFS